jgi:hypothetical protein
LNASSVFVALSRQVTLPLLSVNPITLFSPKEKIGRGCIYERNGKYCENYRSAMQFDVKTQA